MTTTPTADALTLERLCAGDEQAFVDLVGRHHDAMLRLARTFVPSLAVAEEVVQETWLIAVRGLAGFEGRSSVKTWLYRVLINRARSARVREHRHHPIGDPDRAVDRSRFDRDGRWALPHEHWVDDLEDRLRAGELSEPIRTALDELPVLQRNVVTLRDLEGMKSVEVCELLNITQGNQRVLLHRGRSRMRLALELSSQRSEGPRSTLAPPSSARSPSSWSLTTLKVCCRAPIAVGSRRTCMAVRIAGSTSPGCAP